MTMHYDKEIFEKFRDLAITKEEDLPPVGAELFSNYYDGPVKILTGVKISDFDSKYFLAQIVGYRGAVKLFLGDNNIGASWNPWLLFLSEDTADQCRKELKVAFSANIELL